MKTLTIRQKEILDFIKLYIARHKFPPTIREISQNFDISVKGAYDHVKALEKKGNLRCDTNRSRAIEVIENEQQHEVVEIVHIPVLGNVAAGKPLFAEDNFEGSLPFPASQLGTGQHFALNVRGDSMQDAGILDGDIAIFKQQATAENGDIVVATVNEAVTLKRFFKEKNRVKLKAENPMYPPIYTQNVRILGKLARIVRNYD